jgi:hypothetical protein
VVNNDWKGETTTDHGGKVVHLFGKRKSTSRCTLGLGPFEAMTAKPLTHGYETSEDGANVLKYAVTNIGKR